MDCENCGNEIEDFVICSDCEIELRQAAKKTPVELPTKQEFNTLLEIQTQNRIKKLQENKILKGMLAQDAIELFSVIFQLQYYREVLSNILPD